MAKDFIDYELLERLSETDKVVDLPMKMIKLQEEVGELAQAFLAHNKSKNASKSAQSENTRLDILEEACDVLNVTIDIINAYAFTDEESKEMFDKKLRKWLSKTDLVIYNKYSDKGLEC